MQFSKESNYNSTGPSPQNISNAAFKAALKNMGKKSKKFAQLAGVFKKKNLFNGVKTSAMDSLELMSHPYFTDSHVIFLMIPIKNLKMNIHLTLEEMVILPIGK